MNTTTTTTDSTTTSTVVVEPVNAVALSAVEGAIFVAIMLIVWGISDGLRKGNR